MGDGIKILARYFSEKHDVLLLTNKQLDVEEKTGLSVVKVMFDKEKVSDFINPYSYYRIYKAIRGFKYDVVFVYNGHPANHVVYRLVDLKKTAIFLHDPTPHSRSTKENWKIRLASKLKIDYKKFARIVVSSNAMKESAMISLGITDPEKVQVNYLGGIENLFFDLEPMEEDIDVLFFGRAEYYKGLDVLVECAKRMKETKFLIVGKGNMKEIYGIEQLPENVERVDRYVPDKELATMIKRSEVVVLPYRDATGSQTIQTAFYYGKPVVATAVGGFPEYVRDGKDGLIIPPNDVEALTESIKKLLDSPEQRKAMGEMANEQLRTTFDNEVICERYYAIFNQVININRKQQHV